MGLLSVFPKRAATLGYGLLPLDEHQAPATVLNGIASDGLHECRNPEKKGLGLRFRDMLYGTDDLIRNVPATEEV